MPSHADILDRPEPLTIPFWVSLTLHILVIGGLSAGVFLENRNHLNMGSLTGGGLGGVLVNPVASIPLPNRGGPENPVANDTQSQVPTPLAPKAKAKPAPKVKAPPPNAIALKSDKAPKRPAEAPSQPNKFRDQQKYNDSQLYSNAGQRMSSPALAVQGGGGVRLGDSSPFGEQFGAYANLIRDNIARNWKPSSLGPRSSAAPAVVVRFTIRSDGSVTNVKIGTSSGISAIDISAQRAVEDAQLPALPPNFPRKQADVELKFEVGN
jgi:protein TonB